jgi:hypothetical protein
MMVPSSNNNGSGYLDFFDEAAASQSQQPTVLSANLLGIDESPQLMQPRQNQQQVINANHATVSIVTSGAIAPNIAGLGKIAPSSPNMTQRTNELKSKPKRIYVPAYSCNGGMDTKFNPHPRHAKPSNLHGILSPEEYTREINTLNDKIKKARSTSFDIALLATGPLMIPLAFWGVRHGKQSRRKRTLIEEHVWDFNQRMAMDKRNIQMIWNRSKVVGGSESYLTIEEIENEMECEEEGENEMNSFSPTLTPSTSVRSGRKKFD